MPVSFGATKSDRQVLARPSRFDNCWRRPWKVASFSERLSPVNRVMSSPALLAGQKPMIAFGLNQRSSTICFSISCASSNRALAAGPWFGSSKIAGVAALELVGLQERRPVDIRHEVGDLVGGIDPHAGEARLRRPVTRPVDLERVGAGFGERQALLVELRAGMRVRDLAVLGLDVGDGGVPRLLREQARDYADRTARIRHVDRLTPIV